MICRDKGLIKRASMRGAVRAMQVPKPDESEHKEKLAAEATKIAAKQDRLEQIRVRAYDCMSTERLPADSGSHDAIEYHCNDHACSRTGGIC